MVGTKPISIKDKLLKLMAEKQNVETQISAYGATLAAVSPDDDDDCAYIYVKQFYSAIEQ